MSYLSAGVYIKEVDASAIVPNVSNSMAFFAGEFTKGPIEEPFIITNKGELETYFGKPTNDNYNQWFQCFKFLDYANQLTISRAYTQDQLIDTGETFTLLSGQTTLNDVPLEIVEYLRIHMKVIIGANGEELEIADIGPGANGYTVTFVDAPTSDQSGTLKAYIGYYNSGINVYQDGLSDQIPEGQGYDLYKNYDDFVIKQPLISFQGDTKIMLIAKDAGARGDDISIAVCNPVDFSLYVDDNDVTSTSRAEAFEGISLDGLFQYPPVEDEIGIVIRDGYMDVIETFVVSFDKAAIDGNNKSKYIENVINENSKLVYAVDNEAISSKIDLVQPTNAGDINFSTYVTSHIFKDSQGITYNDTNNTTPIVGPLNFYGGIVLPCTTGDLQNAYMEVENKELFDIDVVIGNEKDEGDAAVLLADTREDCIAFIGARYQDIVGKRSAEATKNLTDYMISATGPMRTMFASFFGNYFRIYDNYAKKYRYINVAGDMAGLRCQTNTNQASWWASAGLQRGQIRAIDRISFSPNQGQRDQLYKNSINPIVNFPGEGNLVWGQKTLLNYASSFDRINVRGLFNTLERAMAKAAKSQVFEFNDSYTRNAILAMFNPFLASVKAGRGISDYLVICDETNNTPDVISRNELHVDIYIKPMYAAEFIQLTFTNVGTRSFAEVIGA